jgi:hypothetical protein
LEVPRPPPLLRRRAFQTRRLGPSRLGPGWPRSPGHDGALRSCRKSRSQSDDRPSWRSGNSVETSLPTPS